MKQNTQKQVKEIKVESPTRKRLILIGKRFSEKKKKMDRRRVNGNGA